MGMSPSRFGMLQLWNESGRTSLLSTTGCVFRPVCAVFFCAAPPPPIVPIPWQTWPRKGGISWVPLRTQETNTGINRMGCLCLFMVDGEVTVSNEMELIIVNSLYKNAISSPKFDFQVRKMGWSWADYHPGSLDSNWGISPQVPQDSTRGFKTQVTPPCFPDISVRSVIFLDNLQWFIHGKIIYKHGFFHCQSDYLMSVCSRRAKVLLAQWNLQHRMSLQDGASQMSLAKVEPQKPWW